MIRARLALLTVLGLVATAALAGGPMFGTGGGPADLLDPAAYIENPAMTPLTLDQAAAGYQLLHAGVLEQGSLRSGFVTYSGRRAFGGLGLGLNVLSTPGWSEKQMRLGYGRRIWNGISLGVRLGLYQHGFDKGDFNIADPDDPLLAGSLSKSVLTMGFGAFYTDPYHPVSLGLVVDDPHEPSISIDGSDPSARRARTIHAGLGWEREIYQGSVSYAHNSVESWFTATGRAFLLWDNALQARLSNRDWALGARFAVHSALWVDYGFSLPFSDLAGETAGSHSLVICFHAFDRPEPPPSYTHRALLHDRYRIAPPERVAVEKPEAGTVEIPILPSDADLYYVGASTDRTDILTKRVTRLFAPNVDLNLLRARPRWQVGVMDTTWSDRVVYSLQDDVQPAEPRDGLPRGNYSERYRDRMDQVGAALNARTDNQVRIVADPSQLERAKFLKEQILQESTVPDTGADESVGIFEIAAMQDSLLHAALFEPVGDDTLMAREETTLYNPDRIDFAVNFLGERQTVDRWALRLLDSGDHTVAEWSGVGAPPDSLAWDLRGPDGAPVDVDNYSFAFSWWKPGGAHFTLPAQEIQFHKRILNETLEFGHGIVDPDELRTARPVIILDPGRAGEVLIPTDVPVDRVNNPTPEETTDEEQRPESQPDPDDPDAGDRDSDRPGQH